MHACPSQPNSSDAPFATPEHAHRLVHSSCDLLTPPLFWVLRHLRMLVAAGNTSTLPLAPPVPAPDWRTTSSLPLLSVQLQLEVPVHSPGREAGWLAWWHSTPLSTWPIPPPLAALGLCRPMPVSCHHTPGLPLPESQTLAARCPLLQWPWCRGNKRRSPPQFFGKDSWLGLLTAAVMGLQHAMAMLAGGCRMHPGLCASRCGSRDTHACARAASPGPLPPSFRHLLPCLAPLLPRPDHRALPDRQQRPSGGREYVRSG